MNVACLLVIFQYTVYLNLICSFYKTVTFLFYKKNLIINEIEANKYVVKNTKFDGFQAYFAGCIFINNSLSTLFVESIFFRNCKSVGSRYYIDADYGCPAYFHIGRSIFCQKFFVEKCSSDKRCIAASLVKSKLDLPMQTNMSSLYNCQIYSEQCSYLLGYGNIIFNDINNSYISAKVIDPGVHAGYGCFKSFHEFLIYFHCSSKYGLCPSSTNCSCRNLLVHTIVSTEHLIYHNAGLTLSIENSYFYNNTLINVFGIINLKVCFYDKKLNVSSAINCSIIHNDPLTSYLPTIDFGMINCLCSNKIYYKPNFYIFMLSIVVI